MWKILQKLFSGFAPTTKVETVEPVKPKVVKKNFTINDKGWVKEVEGNYTDKHGKGIRGGEPEFVIIHYTANNSYRGTQNVFLKKKVSAHFVVDRETPRIVQMVSMLTQAWHAGRSKWHSPLKSYNNLNGYSVGVELINYGYAGDHVPSSERTEDWYPDIHRNGGPKRMWQPYPQAQLENAADLVAAICTKYKIKTSNILGHDDISPDRKVDPGPAFNMVKFREMVKDRVYG